MVVLFAVIARDTVLKVAFFIFQENPTLRKILKGKYLETGANKGQRPRPCNNCDHHFDDDHHHFDDPSHIFSIMTIITLMILVIFLMTIKRPGIEANALAAFVAGRAAEAITTRSRGL